MITFLTAAIFLLAGLVQGMTGFGSALVAIPLLAYVIDIKTAVPLCMLNGLIITGYLSFHLRRHLNWQRIQPLLAGSLPGIIVGATLLTRIDADMLKKMTGLLLFLYGGYSLLIRPRSLGLGRKWGYPAGFFSGAIGAAISAGGPPAIIYTSLTNWKKEEIKATLTGFFAVNGAFTVLGHAVSGLTTAEVLGYFAVTAPTVLCGSVAGSLLSRRISRGMYLRIVLCFLVLMGIMLMRG